MTETIRITEIFYSLQGETTLVGLPTVFVRLTGCPLRCQYCDTAYAFKGGELKSIDSILSEVASYSPLYVTVTGGEPLAQKNCLTLLHHFCEQKYVVSLETSGAMDVAQVDNRVIKILDIKTPASKESHRNMLSNFSHLQPKDQVKFVICDRDDYEWSKAFVDQYSLKEQCEVLFSPSHQQLAARELADWIVADRLPVRFQMQLHKALWNDEPGR
ncbi:MAG: 7-carboxy-7-deazaguanine synthase QueE [Gammaproteobacteria bacterium]